METNQNNNQGTGNTNSQAGSQPNFNGFDPNGLLNNASFMEWLKPLLSGAGAMTGTYFMWIKPMQEKLDAMNDKITEQDKSIIHLKHEVGELEKELSRTSHKTESNSSETLKGSGNDYFETRNRDHQSANFRKRRNLNL